MGPEQPLGDLLLFVYVDDVDEAFGELRDGGDVQVRKDPQDMFWGERVGGAADPDGNPSPSPWS
jgi:uncharacterized glyoxalase superfamily protein PhnB